MTKKTQKDIIKEYFTDNPNRDIHHREIVDWAVKKWKRLTGEVFRDPDRAIRSLSQAGFLIKVNKGVYKFDIDFVESRELEDFTPAQKNIILKRDDYKCVICGKGKKDGIELHIDHIKPKDFGGKAILENGQILCGQHNYLKKNLKQTETGKKMFIRLYDLAKVSGDENLIKFCLEILEVFENNKINGHIEWKK